MRVRLEPKWKCHRCGSIHDDEDAAFECCRPEVSEGYLCSECSGWWSTENEALDSSRSGYLLKDESSMPTRDQVRSATFNRIEQLSLLMDLRDGPVRLHLMNGYRGPERHRHYDICGLTILPWVLDPTKGWVSLTDRNLYSITTEGLAAIEAWETHQFDEVDVRLRAPALKVRPEPTAHLRAFRHDELWPRWAAEWDARQLARRREARKSSTVSRNG